MDKVLAFIDESGDPHFNEGASSHLEYSSVLIESDYQDQAIETLENIRTELGLPELKSKKLSEQQRIRLLELLQTLDFKFINLSIDKDKIRGEWRSHFRTFYKFAQKLLNAELHKLYPDRIVSIDRYGGDDYQESLINYLDRQLQLDFTGETIIIDSAENNILIQLADIIAGTRRKLIAGDFREDAKIQELLNAKKFYILKFPDNFQKLLLNNISIVEDRKIAELCISRAERYVDQNRKSLQNQYKVIVLDYLLFQVKFINSNKYIYSYELQDWLKQNKIHISDEDFSNRIIGGLKDEGVVIASSRRGLKIPISESELVDYINYYSSRFITSIKRLKKTYETLTSEFNSTKIFDQDEFEIQKRLFDVIDK